MKKSATLFMIALFAIFSMHTAYAQVPITQLRASDCGKINLTPTAQIACVPVANANLYEWEFRDVNTNAVVGTKTTSWYVFAANMVNFLQWNTQYNIAVRARIGGTFGVYGASCVIGLMEDPAVAGVPSITLRPEFCNSNSFSLSNTVACMAVPMGSMYEFTFTNVATQQVTSVTQPSIYLPLSTPALGLQEGETYQVSTRGFVYNTWSAVTSFCTVSIQLPITNVVAGFTAPACEGSDLQLTTNFDDGIAPFTFAWTGPNGFTSSIQNPVVANAVTGDYSVTVTGSFGSGSGSSTVNITLNPSPVAPVITGDFGFCPNNIATLDAGSGYDGYVWSNGMQTQTAVILLPAIYTVTVSNSFGCTATGSVDVTPCSSNVANTQVRSIDCGKVNLTPTAQFACNPVANATAYQWEFRNPSTLALYASYTSAGIIATGNAVNPDLQFNTQYVTRVRAKVGGEWGNYSTLCTVGLGENPTVTGVLPTQLRTQFCGTTLPLTAIIACSPVSMGSKYEFEFTDNSDMSVTTKMSNLIYLNLSSVSPSLMAGHTYAVRVRGFVYNTWSDYGTACNITISTAPAAGSRESAPEMLLADELGSTEIAAASTMQLLAYPNPFDNESGVLITSSENKNVTVYLFDAVGQMVWSKQIATNQYQQFTTQDLAPGLYFMSTSENKNNSIKIMKSK